MRADVKGVRSRHVWSLLACGAVRIPAFGIAASRHRGIADSPRQFRPHPHQRDEFARRRCACHFRVAHQRRHVDPHRRALRIAGSRRSAVASLSGMTSSPCACMTNTGALGAGDITGDRAASCPQRSRNGRSRAPRPSASRSLTMCMNARASGAETGFEVAGLLEVDGRLRLVEHVDVRRVEELVDGLAERRHLIGGHDVFCHVGEKDDGAVFVRRVDAAIGLPAGAHRGHDARKPRVTAHREHEGHPIAQ